MDVVAVRMLEKEHKSVAHHARRQEMAIWFEESLYDHIKLRIEVERVVADSVTTFGQRAFIFDTVKHGRFFASIISFSAPNRTSSIITRSWLMCR